MILVQLLQLTGYSRFKCLTNTGEVVASRNSIAVVICSVMMGHRTLLAMTEMAKLTFSNRSPILVSKVSVTKLQGLLLSTLKKKPNLHLSVQFQLFPWPLLGRRVWFWIPFSLFQTTWPLSEAVEGLLPVLSTFCKDSFRSRRVRPVKSKCPH